MTLTFDAVTLKVIGYLCYRGWMCKLSLRRVGQCILELLIGNVFCTIDPNDLDL